MTDQRTLRPFFWYWDLTDKRGTRLVCPTSKDGSRAIYAGGDQCSATTPEHRPAEVSSFAIQAVLDPGDNTLKVEMPFSKIVVTRCRIVAYEHSTHSGRLVALPAHRLPVALVAPNGPLLFTIEESVREIPRMLLEGARDTDAIELCFRNVIPLPVAVFAEFYGDAV